MTLKHMFVPTILSGYAAGLYPIVTRVEHMNDTGMLSAMHLNTPTPRPTSFAYMPITVSSKKRDNVFRGQLSERS